MKQRTGRKLFGFLLSLALILGLMLAMSLTAYADSTIYNPASTYNGFDTLASGDATVTIDGVQYENTPVDWYVIGYDSTAKTVTLLSKQSFGNKAFNSQPPYSNAYDGSEIKSYVEGLTGKRQPLEGIKDALANISVTGDPSISGAVPYLLSTSEARGLSDTKKRELAPIGGCDRPATISDVRRSSTASTATSTRTSASCSSRSVSAPL